MKHLAKWALQLGDWLCELALGGYDPNANHDAHSLR